MDSCGSIPLSDIGSHDSPEICWGLGSSDLHGGNWNSHQDQKKPLPFIFSLYSQLLSFLCNSSCLGTGRVVGQTRRFIPLAGQCAGPGTPSSSMKEASSPMPIEKKAATGHSGQKPTWGWTALFPLPTFLSPLPLAQPLFCCSHRSVHACGHFWASRLSLS